MDAIDQIRDFNRYYTNALGLLGRNHLGSGRALTEVRVLYELGAEAQSTARGIAGRLGIDEAQMSRLVSRLVRDGLVTREADTADARQYALTLTAAGQALHADLAARSRAELTALLPGEARQAIVASAFGAVRQAMAGPGEIAIRGLAPGDTGWITEVHGALYARDEGYDHRFEALVARILADFLERNDRAREAAWIAEEAGHRLGTISCMKEDDETARLRLFILVPEARGMGMGQRLHDTCVRFAREAGYRRMVLWTHESHKAACALYARNGWRLVRSIAGEAYGQRVVDQDWELAL